MMEHVMIRKDTMDKIVGYLGTQRWDHVEGLIHEIVDQLKLQKQESHIDKETVNCDKR